MDIEGAEHAVFRGFEKQYNRHNVGQFLLETHESTKRKKRQLSRVSSGSQRASSRSSTQNSTSITPPRMRSPSCVPAHRAACGSVATDHQKQNQSWRQPQPQQLLHLSQTVRSAKHAAQRRLGPPAVDRPPASLVLAGSPPDIGAPRECSRLPGSAAIRHRGSRRRLRQPGQHDGEPCSRCNPHRPAPCDRPHERLGGVWLEELDNLDIQRYWHSSAFPTHAPPVFLQSSEAEAAKRKIGYSPTKRWMFLISTTPPSCNGSPTTTRSWIPSGTTNW